MISVFFAVARVLGAVSIATTTVVPELRTRELPVVEDCLEFRASSESQFAVPHIQVCRRTEYYAGATLWYASDTRCQVRALDTSGGFTAENSAVNTVDVGLPSVGGLPMDRVVCSGYGPCVIATEEFYCSPGDLILVLRFERALHQVSRDNGGRGYVASFPPAQQPTSRLPPNEP